MTYGQLAWLCGNPGAARQVGAALRRLGDLPWHRVINAQGGLSTYRLGFGDLQRQLLEAEGIAFSAGGRCDLARYRWDGFGPGPAEGQGCNGCPTTSGAGG
jgi:methylated-DNA-protein-cysteine methyltransferase-like protein